MIRARDVMQEKVRTIREDASLLDLDRALTRERQTGLPVVDGDGRLVGVVSRSDVVKKLASEQSQEEYISDRTRAFTDYDETHPEESIQKLGARAGERMAAAQVRDLMSHEPVTVDPDRPVREVARLLGEAGVHRLPVVDAEGRLCGLVTTMDLVRLVAERGIAED